MSLRISLPEQRALLGSPQPQTLGPVSLDPNDIDIARYQDRAQEIFDGTQTRFGDEDLHSILATLLLGL